MFNLYLYEKAVKESEDKANDPSNLKSFKNDKYHKRRENMALRYRERMTDFISTLNSKKLKMKDEFMHRLQDCEFTIN